MERMLDWLFPFRRAMFSVRLTYRGALWLYLLFLVFGPGLIYAIIQSL